MPAGADATARPPAEWPAAEWQPLAEWREIQGKSLTSTPPSRLQSGLINSFPFDPAGMNSKDMQIREIKNGRLAMVGQSFEGTAGGRSQQREERNSRGQHPGQRVAEGGDP